MIEVKNLSCVFSYGMASKQLSAVSPLTVSFQSGKRYAIVGESGSGKTTLARMVAGLQKPSVGMCMWMETRSIHAVRPEKPILEKCSSYSRTRPLSLILK